MDRDLVHSDHKQRRESYEEGPAMAWTTFSMVPPESHLTHPFIQQRNEVYFGTSNFHTEDSFSHPTVWSMHDPSGSCTPTASYETTIQEHDDGRQAYGHTTANSSLPSGFNNMRYDPMSQFNSHDVSVDSPLMLKGWMSPSSPDDMDTRAATVHPRHRSSQPGSITTLRRDGIRKKNARFEIPADRNLRTIDQMINNTSDETEIKELKQQKRLLRNRQAALDSRQRKKQHTERLEEEKKHYTVVINELEEALGRIKVQENEWNSEKELWMDQQRQYEHYIEQLLAEKEEMVRKHTVECGELRKKNTILEQMQRMEHTAMSVAPSSTGFSSNLSDFDHLTMDNSPWDTFPINQDYSAEAELSNDRFSPPHRKLDSAGPPKADEKSSSSGLLFLLLLYGAWMASRNADSSPTLPSMPEEVRTASTSVIRHLYHDSGIDLDGLSTKARNDYPFQANQIVPSMGQTTTLSALELTGTTQAPLEVLHQQLINPSKAQEATQLFSLSATQYNELTSDETYSSDATPASRRPGQQLGMADPTMHHSASADSIAHSLMWNTVPKHVLADFARLVTEAQRSSHS